MLQYEEMLISRIAAQARALDPQERGHDGSQRTNRCVHSKVARFVGDGNTYGRKKGTCNCTYEGSLERFCLILRHHSARIWDPSQHLR